MKTVSHFDIRPQKRVWSVSVSIRSLLSNWPKEITLSGAYCSIDGQFLVRSSYITVLSRQAHEPRILLTYLDFLLLICKSQNDNLVCVFK